MKESLVHLTAVLNVFKRFLDIVPGKRQTLKSAKIDIFDKTYTDFNPIYEIVLYGLIIIYGFCKVKKKG